MELQPVYLDHAATTPVRPEVREAMLPFLGGELFGNPSSGHRFGRAVRAAVERARGEVAAALGVRPDQVIFTSGGTEADNLAVVGASLHAGECGRPMFAAVAATEHKAILAAAHAVSHLGGREVLLPVQDDGLLRIDALEAALTERPSIVSVMWVNNETGVVQPIERLSSLCRAAGVPFHTDLVQAFGKVAVRLTDLPIDFATISAHKIGGPKGVGALVVRDRAKLAPLQHGGGQQHGIRPGTENVAGIIGLGRAAALAAEELAEEQHKCGRLRDLLAERLLSSVSDLRITGETAPRAPHILNVQACGADGESLLAQLDLAGVAASSGSACTTGSVEPSHVLTAMGIPRDHALSAVRLSLGRETTEADVLRAAEVFPQAVEKSRKLAAALGRLG
jgi:cysteine desulfurase